jgi:hypothetical protein
VVDGTSSRPRQSGPQGRQRQRDRALAAYCDREWQVHECRQQHPPYLSVWPTVGALKANWPQLACHLIQARTWIQTELEGPGRQLPPVPYEVLDPPPPPPQDWQVKYAHDLERVAGVAWDMAGPNPISAVFARARLTRREAVVAAFWLAGNDAGDEVSLSSLAALTGHQARTTKTLLERIRYKLAALDPARQPAWGGSPSSPMDEGALKE